MYDSLSYSFSRCQSLVPSRSGQLEFVAMLRVGAHKPKPVAPAVSPLQPWLGASIGQRIALLFFFSFLLSRPSTTRVLTSCHSRIPVLRAILLPCPRGL